MQLQPTNDDEIMILTRPWNSWSVLEFHDLSSN